MQAAGTGMGAAGFAVYDDTACMVDLAFKFSQFLYVESCGQCPACKLGLGEISDRLNEIEACRGSDRDIARIGGWLPTVTDGARCYLPVEEQLDARQHPAGLPRRVRSPHRGLLPQPAATLSFRRSSTSPTAGRLRREAAAQAARLDLRGVVAEGRPPGRRAPPATSPVAFSIRTRAALLLVSFTSLVVACLTFAVDDTFPVVGPASEEVVAGPGWPARAASVGAESWPRRPSPLSVEEAGATSGDGGA